MHTSVAELSNYLDCSPTHTKTILKELYSEEEIERSATGTKILLKPDQVRAILKSQGIHFKPQIISIAQQKGGVGKSTISINCAVQASKSLKCLVLDTDPESNITSFFLDPEIFENQDVPTIRNILKGEVTPTESIYKTRYDNIDIIPCRGSARKADRELLSKNQGTAIRDLLTPLLETYDLIFIDQGPSFNALNVSCYLACDKVIMPVSDSIWAIEGISLTISDIEQEAHEFRVPMPELKVLKSGLAKNQIAGKEASEAIRENFGEYLLDLEIPNASVYKNTINDGISIFESSRALPVHKAPYSKLLDSILVQNENAEVLQ